MIYDIKYFANDLFAVITEIKQKPSISLTNILIKLVFIVEIS